jgi:hypothetical protein
MFNQLTQKVVDPDGALGGAALQTDDYFWDGGELVGVYGYNSLVLSCFTRNWNLPVMRLARRGQCHERAV